jgi:hypothetical protein
MHKHPLSLLFWLLALAPFAGCGPWEGHAPNGKLGVAWFRSNPGDLHGYKGEAIAAEEAHVQFHAGVSGAVRFRSAAEHLFTVTDDGLVTTHAPGRADLIAVDAASGELVDMIALELVPTHQLVPNFETEPLLLVGWTHNVSYTRRDEKGRSLLGQGGIALEVEGVLDEVSTREAWDRFGSIDMKARQGGAARLVARAGVATSDVTRAAVPVDEVDDIHQLRASIAYGMGATVSLEARSRTGQAIVGLPCEWTDLSPDVRLESNKLRHDGRVYAAFSGADTFSATCHAAHITRRFAIAVQRSR